jgi:hypothetical protein
VEGVEKEHKWLRNFQLEPQLRPQLRDPMTLLPWQVLGVQFLHFCRWHYGYALLADEMGVGKVCFFLRTTLTSRPSKLSVVSMA